MMKHEFKIGDQVRLSKTENWRYGSTNVSYYGYYKGEDDKYYFASGCHGRISDRSGVKEIPYNRELRKFPKEDFDIRPPR